MLPLRLETIDDVTQLLSVQGDTSGAKRKPEHSVANVNSKLARVTCRRANKTHALEVRHSTLHDGTQRREGDGRRDAVVAKSGPAKPASTLRTDRRPPTPTQGAGQSVVTATAGHARLPTRSVAPKKLFTVENDATLATRTQWPRDFSNG
jgi:hypothetical protein